MFGTYTQQLLIFMNKKEKYIEFIVDRLIEDLYYRVRFAW